MVRQNRYLVLADGQETALYCSDFLFAVGGTDDDHTVFYKLPKDGFVSGKYADFTFCGLCGDRRRSTGP